jgi:hypothetical protein
MRSAVMHVRVRFERHEPPGAVCREGDGCRAGRCLRRGGCGEPIDVPEEPKRQSDRKEFRFDEAAADFASPFRRVGDAGRFELAECTARTSDEKAERAADHKAEMPHQSCLKRRLCVRLTPAKPERESDRSDGAAITTNKSLVGFSVCQATRGMHSTVGRRRRNVDDSYVSFADQEPPRFRRRR